MMSAVRTLLPAYAGFFFSPSFCLSFFLLPASFFYAFFLRFNFDEWLSSAKRISLAPMMRRMLIIIICEWTDERWMSAVMEATTPCPVNPPRHSAANYSALRRYRQQNGCGGTSRSRSGNDNHNEAYQVHQFTRCELHLAEQSVTGTGLAGDKAGWGGCSVDSNED